MQGTERPWQGSELRELTAIHQANSRDLEDQTCDTGVHQLSGPVALFSSCHLVSRTNTESKQCYSGPILKFSNLIYTRLLRASASNAVVSSSTSLPQEKASMAMRTQVLRTRVCILWETSLHCNISSLPDAMIFHCPAYCYLPLWYSCFLHVRSSYVTFITILFQSRLLQGYLHTAFP